MNNIEWQVIKATGDLTEVLKIRHKVYVEEASRLNHVDDTLSSFDRFDNYCVYIIAKIDNSTSYRPVQFISGCQASRTTRPVFCRRHPVANRPLSPRRQSPPRSPPDLRLTTGATTPSGRSRIASPQTSGHLLQQPRTIFKINKSVDLVLEIVYKYRDILAILRVARERAAFF